MKSTLLITIFLTLALPCYGQSDIPEEFWSQEIVIKEYEGRIGTPALFRNPIFVENHDERVYQVSSFEDGSVLFDLYSKNSVTGKK